MKELIFHAPQTKSTKPVQECTPEHVKNTRNTSETSASISAPSREMHTKALNLPEMNNKSQLYDHVDSLSFCMD